MSLRAWKGRAWSKRTLGSSSDGGDPIRKADYELDVSFLHGNKIVVVECKTCDMTSTKETTPILNKLSVIREKLGEHGRGSPRKLSARQCGCEGAGAEKRDLRH